MLDISPTPADLGRWLLSHEAVENESPAALVAAADHAHARLRASLSVFLGQAGFDSLWARAQSLAQPSIASVGDSVAREAAHRLGALGWSATLNGRSVDETRDVVLAAFTSFITLLFTFIGAELGARLIYQAWLEPSLVAPDTFTGAATL